MLKIADNLIYLGKALPAAGGSGSGAFILQNAEVIGTLTENNGEYSGFTTFNANNAPI